MGKGIFLTLFFIALSACASTPSDSDKAADPEQINLSEAASGAYVQTRDGLGDAALSPLEDLNLRRDDIPELLADTKSPYDGQEEMSCPQIADMIRQLDAVLGKDWDTEAPDDRLATEELADAASTTALNAVASQARDLIPFRSLIRQATGADSHQKKYNRAFKIGAQRRAYLKGYGLAKGCPAPARPDFETLHEEDEVIFKGDDPHALLSPAEPPAVETASLPSVHSIRP